MRPNEIILMLLAQSGMSKSDFAKKLGVSRGTLQERLNQKNMSVDLLNSMLVHLNCEIVIQPVSAGRRKDGQVVVA